MRWSHVLVAAMFVLAIAACSSPATSSSGPDGGGSSQGSAASQGAPASQAVAPSQGGGGGGGDADEIFNALIPPSSTEVLKTTASGSIFASYTSTDSIESLTSHYQSAIPATGMEIFSTTNAQGGTAWVFAESQGSSFGGSVSVFPNTNGEGTAVTITVTDGG